MCVCPSECMFYKSSGRRWALVGYALIVHAERSGAGPHYCSSSVALYWHEITLVLYD